ncbi:MAG: 6-bladed beta-propeller [Bacteroidales bacterium]|nr:6-bladed beta-propeller [Bacteroidales bacterium]
MNRHIPITSFGILLLTCLVCACNRQVANAPTPESLVIFPPPPDTTRIQFLTHFSSSGDLEGKRGGFHRFLFGEEAPLNMIKPYGVTVHKEKVYVCDTGLGGLAVMDLAEGAFEYFIPGGKGQLKLPINCCVDKRGYLFVADANRKQIVVFDRERKYLHAFGETEGFKPTDVAVHQGRIWVANVQDHAVYVYGIDDYKLIGKRPDTGEEEDGFIRQSTNISIINNTLYVSDFGDFNVKKFSMDGEYMGVVGGYGNGPGSFTRPKGIALDREENLYVVDAAFENVQIFSAGGDLLMHFGGAYKGAGAMWLPAAVEISYENLSFFEPYVDESFELKYLIYVTNQYGPAKVNVYGFVEEKSTSL